MIVDTKRGMPEEWTDALCRELFNHARWLGQNGNPGGYILTVQLFPFVGVENPSGARFVNPYDEWDYDGMRQWIADNLDEVKISWQRDARPPW